MVGIINIGRGEEGREEIMENVPVPDQATIFIVEILRAI